MPDEVIALGFDFACTARLKLYDEDLEARRLETIAVGATANALGIKPQVQLERSNVSRLDA